MKFKNIKKKNKPKGKKKTKSPSNSRAIPASTKSSADRSAKLEITSSKVNSLSLFQLYRMVLKIFVVFIFVVAVIVVGYDFQRNLQIKQDIGSQRKVLTHDLNFWENFISKHQNYRDAYFQASVLEYKLGNTSKAKMYVEKGLSLDPNSEDGRKIEELLNR